MDEAAARVLPAGYATELNGVSREFRASSGALGLVFVLALLFIFLVLAAQFESFIDPFVILLAVPLSMVGALLALKWSGGTLNVFSQIGLITLVGLITKHGILIVEFSNQLRKQGRETLEAVVEAASLRLRPILMTTGAMVLGALPLALASGAGAESRQQIGWVIVGGMSIGTLLTIFVVPTVYTLSGAQEGARGDRDAGTGAGGRRLTRRPGGRRAARLSRRCSASRRGARRCRPLACRRRAAPNSGLRARSRRGRSRRRSARRCSRRAAARAGRGRGWRTGTGRACPRSTAVPGCSRGRRPA